LKVCGQNIQGQIDLQNIINLLYLYTYVMQYTLTVTEKEIKIIGIALRNMPYKDVATTIQLLDHQLNAQQQPKATKADDEQPKEDKPQETNT